MMVKTNLLRLAMAWLALTSLLAMAAACGPTPTEAPVTKEAATEAPAAEAPATAVPPTEEPAAEEPAAEEPAAEKPPFVIVACDTVLSLDPAEDWSFGGGSGIMIHIYDTLMTFKGEDQSALVPVLLAEIPSKENGGISEDGLTYTMHINPEARFHDGSPVNAEAVKYSIERQITLALGPEFYWTSLDHLEVVDEWTLKVVLQEPSAMFLNLIASPWATRIVNPAVAEANAVDGDMGNAYLYDHDGGSGPYILESYEPEFRQITLVRDPNYWGGWSEGTHIDKVIVRWIDESSTIRSMIEKGDADAVTCITYDDWAALDAAEGVRAEAYPGMLLAPIWLSYLNPPFDNILVRQAMRASLDTESIIDDVMHGMAFPVEGQASYVYAGATASENEVTYDLEQAKALLEEAGYGDGFEFTCQMPPTFPESQATLEVWQADLAKIGVKMNIQSVDWATLQANRTGDNIPDCQNGNTSGDFPEAWSLFKYVLHGQARPRGARWSFYQNDRVTELIEQIGQTYDPAERQPLYQEIADITAQDVPNIWVFGFKQMVALRDNIQGYEYNLALGFQYFPLETMWREGVD